MRTARTALIPPVSALITALIAALIGGCGLPFVAPPTPQATPTTVRLVEAPTRTPSPQALRVLPTTAPTPLPTPTPTFAPVTGVVVSTVDGDTVRVLVGGESWTVGYLWVDAPPPIEPLGRLAADANRSIVEGKLVTLLRDGAAADRDPRGRLMRYVYLQDGTFVNAELVRQGWAEVQAIPATARTVEAELDGLEEGAIATGIGLWAKEQGPVTSRPVKLRQGPGPEFPEAETLPTNTPLDIVALSPDGQWFQLATGSWIARFNVTNPPATGTLELATVPTPAVLETLPPPTFTPTPLPTPTPVPTAAIGSLKIVEVDRIDEYVVIRNDTSQTVDLEGWKLQSEAGNQICTLSGTMGQGDLLTIWAQSGPLTDFSCAFAGPIWEDFTGDAAVLWSPDGRVISRMD